VAHGRPVIGSNVPGLAVVVEEGVSGLLVPPGDAGALSAAMLRFVREGLGARLAAGAVALGTRFTPEGHARRILSLGGIGR
jgi:glycosyltransferase involved in cell wall biosynthesis